MQVRKIIILLLLLGLAGPASLLAQRTSIHDEPGATFRDALELYNKEKFGAARALFEEAAAQITDPQSEMKGTALYYAGLCAAELFHPDAEDLLKDYIARFPTHPGQNLARFHIGTLHYRQRRYREAADWLSSFNGNRLEPERRIEYLFRKGYSHFMLEEYADARQSLSQIRDPGSPYFSPATYYHAHIAYLEKDYMTALSQFQRLSGDDNFGPVIPYYVTHIYYLQGDFDRLLDYAPSLLQEASPRRAGEIARLIGEAHFRAGRYGEAIPYLEQFFSEGGTAQSREDHYQMGFSYQATGNHEQAVRHLERATGAEDSLAQNAWYHLASAYLGTGQKRFARNAFLRAYQLDLEGFITRESLFNYAKLSYELSLDPYNEAILSFQRYIDDYPDSERTAEASAYLVDLYLSTRNYKEALNSLERMQVNTPRLREAYQRVAYSRGVELFNNGAFEEAIAHFAKARLHLPASDMAALSHFWEGEALYRLEQYPRSIEAHQRFLSAPGANRLDVYNRAHYATGYAWFKQQQYPQAIAAFQRFISDAREDRRLLNDAHLRLADSYFITKNYQHSLDYYDRATRIGVIDNDYALLQKGLVYGVMGRFGDKVSILQQFLTTYSNSSFADDAKYELANTHLTLNNNSQALAYFSQIINQHPNSGYVRSSMLKTGLIHYNNNEDQQALEVLRKVISDYPGSAESQEALSTMRNIYVSMDRVDEFVRFSQDLGFANISTAQQDTLSYVAAENRYMQGDCENAVRSFTNYLERFPQGIFSLNAQFYRAECEFRRNNFNLALEGYREIISRPKSKFTENALSRASNIEYRDGNFHQANEYFIQLEEVAEFRANTVEARTGQMRSLFRLGRYEEAIGAASRVIETDKIPEEILQEAHLLKGKSALSVQDHETARASLQQAADAANNVIAAEAMYHLALIRFRQGRYEEAEQMIFDFVGKLSAYDYWLARTFLLLADVYMETENTFQARHTLQSIIDNYAGEDLREEAMRKIRIIDELEESEDQPGEEEPLEVEFGQQEN